MRIEPATIDDLDTVADQWVSLAAEQRRHGSHLAAEGNREAIRMVLAAAVVDDRVLVARADGIVGFVQLEVEEGVFDQRVRRGVIRNLYVVPAERNAGTGSELLDAAERALAESGADVIAIEAMADNEAARRLYRRRGYRPHRVEYERTAESDTHSKEGR